MSKHPAPTPDAAAAPAAPGKKSLFGKLKIVGIILGVVVIEWVVAYLYLPGAPKASKAANQEAELDEEATDDEHASDHDAGDEHGDEHKSEKKGHDKEDAHGSGHDKKDAHEKKGHDKGGHGGHDKPGKAEKSSHSDHVEVDLGEYTVTGYQPVSNSTLYISFHLYGTIRYKDNNEFESRLEDSKHRVRDNVIVIIRSAEITDLTDAGLGLIKRRILETTNKTLGKPLLQGIVFSEFSFVEQ
jgi:flagellar basal body-associated protein FliL